MQPRTDKIREQDALRQEKYYNSKKDEINKRRREQYALKKASENPTAIGEGIIPESPIPVIGGDIIIKKAKPDNIVPMVIVPTEKPMVIVPDKPKTFITQQLPEPTIKVIKKATSETQIDSKIPNTPNDILMQKLQKLDLNAYTMKKYVGDLRRVFALISNKDLLPEIRNMEVLESIKDSTYATNTKQGLVQILLFMITQFNLSINKKALDATKQYFELLKMNAKTQANETANDEENSVLTFKEYLLRIKDTFGEDSKMFVLSSLYNEATIRDDFALKIVERTPKDTNENYMVDLKTGMILIINTYKTQEAYGQIKVKLSKKLSKQIKAYMLKNNLQSGDYLFGDQKHSDYVRYHNSKIGVEGGISNYRRMKISEELSKNLTDEERIQLAQKMKHSPMIQLTYVRKLK